METRLIYAIILIFIWWIYNFILKIVAEKKYNIWDLAFYWYIIWIIISLIFIFWKNISIYSLQNIWIIIFIWFFNSSLFILTLLTKVQGMRSIDTVLFFPIYKTIWPIIVTIFSLFVFWETLSLKEAIWIALWILVPLLLITKKEKMIQKNLSRWLAFVFLTAILTAFVSFWTKFAMDKWVNLEYLVLSICTFWAFFSYLYNKFFYIKDVKNIKNKTTKWFIFFIIISWILNFFGFYLFALAMEWNLAIVFTVHSFSILIPIILSITFYKEHFDFKKLFVIFLSIISIILFI